MGKALDAIRDTATMYERAIGRMPNRMKVGAAALDALADETHIAFGPPGKVVTLARHREMVREAAAKGELTVYGMRVQLVADHG